ncbi:MAG TPA: HesA/MoeB/ThiF family protein [Candidatus Gastranaerophilales bacterium]|nr:HesA/MoeB/ThiF family protein [Candidatus Gastranaerophilales bacterium]
MNINDYRTKERFKRSVLIKQIGNEGQQKLFEKKILVAGAGGLGSGVISSLVSLGIGSLGIIDFDKVERSNLNRQFIHAENAEGKFKAESAYQWIKNYSSDTRVNIYKIKLDENFQGNFFENYDLVIDCFDSFKSKFVLNEICVKKGVPFIHGGVEEFSGQVLTVIPGKSSCLSCLFDDPDIYTQRIIGIISPTVNVIASIQAMEAVKYLLNTGSLLTDTLLTYDGLKQKFKKINLTHKKNCSVCMPLIN